MWTKNDALYKPGCLANADDDEPIFIVRGQDVSAPVVVKIWAAIVESLNAGVSIETIESWADHTLLTRLRLRRFSEKTEEATTFVEEIREWQKTHHTKIPD